MSYAVPKITVLLYAGHPIRPTDRRADPCKQSHSRLRSDVQRSSPGRARAARGPTNVRTDKLERGRERERERERGKEERDKLQACAIACGGGRHTLVTPLKMSTLLPPPSDWWKTDRGVSRQHPQSKTSKLKLSAPA